LAEVAAAVLAAEISAGLADEAVRVPVVSIGISGIGGAGIGIAKRRGRDPYARGSNRGARNARCSAYGGARGVRRGADGPAVIAAMRDDVPRLSITAR